MPNKLIDIINITKSYDENVILDQLNLYIRENEFLTLLGPSGCGKTTLLRILGGFETPDSGDIIFDGKNINNLPPNRRQLNTVFQKYALFSHMSIAENIAFGLKIKGKSKGYIRDKIHYALKLVNLEGYGDRTPDFLSGGQQQRIAIARAIVNEPKVLLLDEPLGALDLKLRQDMQYELMRLKEELGISAIPEQLHFAGTFPISFAKEFHGKMFRDEEIAFVYIYREPVNIAELVLQTEEVEEVQWFDLEEVYEQCGKRREIFCVPEGGLGVVRSYLKRIEKN